MGFASAWLAKHALFPRLIDTDPEAGTCIIVVIPACGEADIQATIDSLARCQQPACNCEVIVVVNAPGKASEDIIKENKRTVLSLRVWRDSSNCFFRLFCCDMGVQPDPRWGVGHARKAGMDEAARRFDILNNPKGLIVSLDADCLVSENYFTELYETVQSRPEINACSISLINGRNDEDLPEETCLAAQQYELERRYLLFGMRYAGFPWCFDTSGAAMAVKAEKYIKAGGMNKREAGEDFWFIRKLLPAGGFIKTDKITVYHSSRISRRVPFGTGMSVNELLSGGENSPTPADPSLFDDLKNLWKGANVLYKCRQEEACAFYNSLPELLRKFLTEESFINAVAEISENTASPESFAKRYFTRFDSLFSLRYLNFAREKQPGEKNIIESCSLLALKAGFTDKGITSFSSALNFYRASEAWISYSPF